MDKFECLRAFTQVVEQGGFAAAARQMNLSRSAVNKLVIHLEQDLGVKLLQRTTRCVTPTPTGLAFYDRCLQILTDLAEAETAVSQTQAEPKGLLKINAPMSFGIMHLAPLVADFAVLYPAVRVQVTLDDRPLDPFEAGYDLHIRIGERLYPSNLVVHPIYPTPLVLCAAPAYAARQGLPQTPADLREHSCLHYGYLSTGNQWRFTGAQGEETIAVTGVLCSNNGEVLRSAAIRGLGLVLLPQFLVTEALAAGTLVPLLPGYQPPQTWVQVLYPVNRHLSIKVKLFTAFLRDHLAPTPTAEP
ncbi:LysR family transcriptional regulator [Prochlorothrix hollandica]|uniref:LysR family transcriptional regulator n=1 Tax=Prochlorothrix hollandica PCC 9006 = CALU 1027 TaxID=317619 RepID=A0A0M2PVI3_PROHO|nr:LysR family transcriptional regulator [Prochlorothrix hollandica]KKI99107.1 LysR family transcriptional regulator [Prochlorothrix hollandica PCC 9006 = CALU 1027]